MLNLQTNYLGLELKNPIIVSSSALTNSVEKIKKLTDNGAAGVVLKSFFEEQINYETSHLLQHKAYPEAGDYILNYAKHNTTRNYIDLISGAKNEVDIPIIASVNCISTTDWIGTAKEFEQAGADAIELNIHIIACDKELSSEKLEEKYYKIIREVKNELNIPIVAKIGYHFSNLARFVDQLYANGARAVVLFNRFFEPDINIQNLKFKSSDVLSNPSDIRHSLRWVGILSDLIPNIEISSSTGVHDSEAAIKMLLAGAQSVQVCSTLYQHGVEELKKIISGIEDWMKEQNFESIEQFRGILSYKDIKDPSIYERAQFMKYFSSIE